MFIKFIVAAISMGVVYLFGCIGETLIEKSGSLNLGLPGIMCFGALGGCVGVALYDLTLSSTSSYFLFLVIVILFTCLFAAFAGLIFVFFTATLKANQNVTGLVLTTFGVGVMKFVGSFISPSTLSKYGSMLKTNPIPYAKLGWFGNIFLSHGLLVYLAIALAIALAIILKKTRIGLFIRSVGESPATADAQGINVSLYRYVCTLIGSAIAGLGGLYFVMDYSGGKAFTDATIDAYGWLALALVIFSIWKPTIGIIGSLFFGALTVLPSYLNISITQIRLFQILPYLMTVVVLIITSILGKQNVQPPASLGINYYREDR